MDELQKCRSQDHLESQLEGLPRSLEEIYDRIVSGLSMRDREDALTILQWLSFSARPLKLAEVAQVVGVVPDLDQGLRFKHQPSISVTRLEHIIRTERGLTRTRDGLKQRPWSVSGTTPVT